MTAPQSKTPATRPTVSVIMANYNGARYLADAIDSVQNQTLRDIEIIVSDDASTDNSVDIVTELMATDPRIRLVRSGRNAGPGAARNKALDIAAGGWIAIVDSDDLIHPDRLATLAHLAESDKADIIADDLIEFCLENTQPARAILAGNSWKKPTSVDVVEYVRLNHLYGRGPQLGYLKPMFRSSLVTSPDQRYDESLRIAEDFDLVLRLLHAGAKMRIHPQPLYFYRRHGQSTSYRLDVSALGAISAANLRFRRRLDDSDRRLARAVNARGRSIDAALAYEDLLEALKARHWRTSFRICFTNPRAAGLLRLPIAVRLRRFAPTLGGRKRGICLPASIAFRPSPDLHGKTAPEPSYAHSPEVAKSAYLSNDLSERPINHASIAVTVCICTFRRASVLDAVKSVVAQQLPAGVSLEILVIDNDDTPTAQTLIIDYNATAGTMVRYLHAPGRNISIARNAALDAVTTPWLAFLDDDEVASPDWLRLLLAARAGASAVFGPCVAVYDPLAPVWIRAGDYHSNRIPDRQNPIITGYTSNALIDMEFVRSRRLRFNSDLGRTGGEDTFFFYVLHRRGGVLRYAPGAIVWDHVVISRTNFRWIALRHYRAGQVYAMMFHKFSRAEYVRTVATSPFKVGACATLTMILALAPGRAMRWLVRGLFHFGILGFALGATIVEEYPSADGALLHVD